MQQELLRRVLPPLRSREEMIEILQREEYGYLPALEYSIQTGDPTPVDERYDLGRVHSSIVDFTITTPYGSHTFPLYRLLHTDGKKRPVIILINFHRGTESHYFPIEELSEREVDYFVFNYKDVTSDDTDFQNGIAPILLPNGQECDSAPGKIMMWAWTAMRVLDYVLTLPGTDPDNVAVLGHSRLGKTALVTGMMDPRFKYAFSNNSGSAGAALARGGSGLDKTDQPYGVANRGETYREVTGFTHWFCKKFQTYKEPMIAEDFDQHYLIASIAPRFVTVVSNSRDDWADQKSEQLSCLAASPAWENAGLPGIVGCDRFLQPGEALLEGRVGYCMVEHNHFLSRHCWHRYLEFIEKHKDEPVEK